MRMLIIALAIGALATSAHAEERLVMAPYPDGGPWKVATEKSGPGQHLREQIPEGH